MYIVQGQSAVVVTRRRLSWIIDFIARLVWHASLRQSDYVTTDGTDGTTHRSTAKLAETGCRERLPRDALHKRRGKMPVCPSVTRRYCIETAKCIIKLLSPSGSQTLLVFPYQTYGNILTGPPNGGRTQGVWKIAIFNQYLALFQKWSNIRNDTIYNVYQKTSLFFGITRSKISQFQQHLVYGILRKLATSQL